MSGIGTVFKKEMKRVFSDRKIIVSLFVLPVVLIIGMYSLMGNLTKSSEQDIESHKEVVYVQNAPESFKAVLKEQEREVNFDGDTKQIKDDILNGETDLLIVFPEDFEQEISLYKQGNEIPQIKTFYNPSEEYSNSVRTEYVTEILPGYRQILLTEKVGDINSLTIFTVDTDNEAMVIQDDDKASGKLLGGLIPYFITLMLFAGAMSLGIDTITGEKERGTMASMLITPVKRSAIVLGKVFSLMLLSAMSAATYIISMVIAMPIVMKDMVGEDSLSSLSMNLNPLQIIQLAVLLIILVFLYVAIISLVAVFARTAKEASTYVMPVYIIVIAVGLITMMSTTDADLSQYFIPLYNSTIALKAIFTQDLTIIQFLATALTNLAAGGIITMFVVKAFHSEKVMFNA